MSYCKQGQKQYLGVQIKFKASEQKEWFKLVNWRKGEMPLGLLTLYLHFYLYLAHSKKFKLVNWGRMKCLLGWRLWCICAYWPIRYILLLVPSSRGILNYWSEKICHSKTHPELFFIDIPGNLLAQSSLLSKNCIQDLSCFVCYLLIFELI